MAVSSEGNWLSQPQRQLSQALDGVDEGLAVDIDEAVDGASLSKPNISSRITANSLLRVRQSRGDHSPSQSE
jgi:hypothetical protein